MCLAYYSFKSCHQILCMTSCSSGDLLNALFCVHARPRMHTVDEFHPREEFAEQPESAQPLPARQLSVDWRTPSSIARNRFWPRSFTPITTSRHSRSCSRRSDRQYSSSETVSPRCRLFQFISVLRSQYRLDSTIARICVGTVLGHLNPISKIFRAHARNKRKPIWPLPIVRKPGDLA